MKEAISVKSNAFYQQTTEKEFSLKPLLELVIIHTDGKGYEIKKDGSIVAKAKLSETRLLVSPEMLTSLITELQLHQKQFEGIKNNADQLTALVKHLSTPENEGK